MKKTITICDICGQNDDEDTLAEEKCVLCNKDICDDCWINYSVEFCEEEKQGEGDKLDWIICKDCLDKINIKGKEDELFLNRIEKETLKHLKQKVFLGELAK